MFPSKKKTRIRQRAADPTSPEDSSSLYSYSTIDEILGKCREDFSQEKDHTSPSVVVALNHVEDPRNLGAVVRTSEALGVRGVIIPKQRAAGMTQWAIQSSCGAAKLIPIARVTNIAETLNHFKAKGFWVIGLSESAPIPYFSKTYEGKFVVVAGGENVGLGTRVKDCCDDLVSIPMLGKTPSLNLSVSVAIVLAEIFRKTTSLKLR
ncbi:RNA methyltransferase [bacterium]|nr:RNA methyltransferase [bacterium]